MHPGKYIHVPDKNVKFFQFLLIIPFFFLIFYSTHNITISQAIDCDWQWHVQCGMDLFNNLFLMWDDYYYTPVTEAYSNMRYTALGDVILYLIYDYAGVDGLIYFRVFCVACTVFFIYLISDKKPNGLKLFVFTIMIVGIYQKMLIRNSMFALIFFPAVLYFFEKKKWVPLLITIIIHSFCHGSYLLSFGIVPILMISNRVIDKKILVLMGIAFIIISYNNPATKSYYNINFVKNTFKSLKDIKETKSLNQTIFSPGAITSADFKDPLQHKKLFTMYAVGIFILTICIAIPRMGYIAPFLAVSFIGLGYIRFVPYMAIISSYVIVRAEKEDNIRNINQWVYFIAFIFISVFCLTQYDKILNPTSRPGLGVSSPKFSERNIKYALEKYPNEDTFTTMTMGGWALLHWLPEKRVNLDTFWEPHPESVRQEYIAAHGNPDLIKEKTALIGLSDLYLIQAFCRTKKWYPERIDQGSVFFNREVKNLHVDVRPEEVEKMTEYHKYVYATTLLHCGVPRKYIDQHFSNCLESSKFDHKM